MRQTSRAQGLLFTSCWIGSPFLTAHSHSLPTNHLRRVERQIASVVLLVLAGFIFGRDVVFVIVR